MCLVNLKNSFNNRTCCIFIALLGLGQPVLAQVSIDDMRLAVDVLKGRETTQSKTWAVETLEESLTEKRDAFTLNVLSIAYLHGLGVTPDTTKAVAYMEEAGEKGFKMAYHNLGMFYKYEEKNRQNFVKAYEAFVRGASAGSPSCCYNTGFMLYKGLGCQQNYGQAVEYFLKAAEANHAPSLFMLGLCYRNGYGVEQDAERATFYLERSATFNYRDAMEELVKDAPENDPNKHFINIDETMEIPASMPDIEPYVPENKGALAGKYQGVLVTYDWSGQHVISERPLTVDMHEKNGRFEGLWVHGNDSLIFHADVTEKGELKFDSTEVVLYDRYSQDDRQLYSFEQADISFTDDYISGQLRLYSMAEKEPERPMYLCLRRCNYPFDDIRNDDNSQIWAYPNPFSSQLNVKFMLDESCPSAKVCIYTRSGVNVRSYGLGALDAGEHTYSLAPKLSDGIYVLHVVAGEHVYETIIISEH